MTQPPSDGSSSPAGPRRIPPGWRLVRLGDVVSEAQGGFASGERDPNGVVQLRMNNVTSRGSLDWSSVLRVPADSGTVERYKLQRGDVLFNNTNSTELVGKSALFTDHDEPVTFSNHFTRLRTIRGLLCPEYLVLWLRAQWQKGLFATICNRWIGQSAVQRDKLLTLELPLPLLPEQQRIARLVTEQMAAVERARVAAEAQLEAAKAISSACLHRLFSEGATLRWPRTTLGKIALRVTDGTHQPPPFAAIGVPFLFVRNIIAGRIDFHVEKYVSQATYEELVRGCRPERGDLLYSAVGSFGVAVVVDTDRSFTFQRHIAHVKLRRDLADARFVANYLNSPDGRRQSEAAALGGAQRTVTLGALAKFEIPMPDLDTQLRAVGILNEQRSAVERMKLAAEQKMASISALPATLLRRAFSGEL
jgi:type I restriction enzyme, S subunit